MLQLIGRKKSEKIQVVSTDLENRSKSVIESEAQERHRIFDENKDNAVIKIEIKIGLKDEEEKSLELLESTNDLYTAKCRLWHRILVLCANSAQVVLISLLIIDSMKVFANSTACYTRDDLSK